MSRWFRLDDDVINDPKILLLPEAMRWIWIAFLCIASKNSGTLPEIEIVALSLRVKKTKAAEYLTRLVTAGLIDRTETGFAPHNWAKRQFKSDVSTERVKRFRKQERNVSETPPHTQTEKQTEKKEDGANAPPELFENQPSPEKRYFDRCKEILGPKGNGLGAKLLKSKGKVVGLAMSTLEMAATKSDAPAYIGAVIRGADRSEMGEKQQPGYGDDWW